jgi:hypothetical protein
VGLGHVGDGSRRSSFRHGVVDVTCDGCVTPEVGAGHAYTCDTAPFDDKNIVD